MKAVPEKPNRKQYWMNLTLAGVAAQVGCVTLVIILVAVFGGLWLDSRFNTRPMLTLILLFGSIPVSLGTMFLIVRLATAKIRASTQTLKTDNPKEANLDRN